MANAYVRCAVYTRKSSEEGLDQSFNSIDAQQEACRAFIQSQKHEGWIALPKRYDDGGFSGGTLERPAIQELLSDIKDGNVDSVVVYKVDRLTRSLADFAKMIELFDARKVSFVSVTQQFNTTTSMGRLTLNVLLSFAQFEREITGERIRDKVAASKKKGMWMGGLVPLGYDGVGRRLVINDGEAEIVRTIFQSYLRIGCLSKLKRLLDQREIRSKVRTTPGGRTTGGRPFSRGALSHLLNNRIYLGEVTHKGDCYQGQHDAIVPRELWDEVAARLNGNNRAHRSGKSVSTPSMLTGKLFDTKGVRFTPTHAVKNGKRYRYYTSQAAVQNSAEKPSIKRFPAHQLDHLVLAQIRELLQAPETWHAGNDSSPQLSLARERARELDKSWSMQAPEEQHKLVRQIVQRVVVGDDTVWIETHPANLVAALLKEAGVDLHSLQTCGLIKLTVKFDSLRRGNELRVIAPDMNSSNQTHPISSLVNMIARSRHWYDLVVSGDVRSTNELAAEIGLSPRYARRILQCATLAPEIVDAVLTGKHRPDLTVNQLLKKLPLNWGEQSSQILRQRL